MKPILAGKTDGNNLKYPVLVSYKLDGVRCLIIDGVVLSRTLKPIPNKFVQEVFGRRELNGLDGELVVGPANATDAYTRTTSGVMSFEGQPKVRFFVFDKFDAPGGFEIRLNHAHRQMKYVPGCELVGHRIVRNQIQLLEYEEKAIESGFEGLMIRDPKGIYKQGQSTAREGYLLKLKRFEDSEATIIAVKQLETNLNEAKKNKLGYQERSTKKSGKKKVEAVGALIVRDVKTGVGFDLGAGFTDALRKQLWEDRENIIGHVVKYKFQPAGVKNKPRFPVFLGFRHPIDM